MSSIQLEHQAPGASPDYGVHTGEMMYSVHLKDKRAWQLTAGPNTANARDFVRPSRLCGLKSHSSPTRRQGQAYCVQGNDLDVLLLET